LKPFDPFLIDAIASRQSILITSHMFPDGDAAGSVTGLAKSLRAAGKHVDIAWSGETGGRFDFLFRDDRILPPEDVTSRYDLAIILDVGSEERTGFPDIIRSLGCPIINIDHHTTNKGFADFDHVDSTASSTCEVVYHLITTAGWPLNADIAEALYTGLVTDSRHFQNDGVTAETFQTAAALKNLGIDTAPIIRRLVQSRSETDLKILGLALSSFKTACAGRIAYVILRHTDITALGGTYRHAWSAGVFGYLISLEHALVSVSFIESESGRVYCEFRSKMGFDVSRIAAQFGGGGHRGASGCSRETPIDDIARDILAELELQINSEI
jgi:bifunctional oligoribonuclease and PAP phosphatase NrnA